MYFYRNRTMQCYLLGTCEADLNIGYKINKTSCCNVFARVSKTTNELQMDCEVGTSAYNFCYEHSCGG